MLERLRELEGERQQSEARALLLRQEADDLAGQLQDARREGFGLHSRAQTAGEALTAARVRAHARRARAAHALGAGCACCPRWGGGVCTRCISLASGPALPPR